jgi:hypothetical protein
MRKWSLASDEERSAKLRSVLCNLSYEKKFDIEHNKAVREWTADIEYLDIVAARTSTASLSIPPWSKAP